MIRPMPGPGMAVRGRGLAEIGQDEDPHGGGQVGALMTFGDQAAGLVDRQLFAASDFVQGVPHVAFQLHAGPFPVHGHVAIEQSTHR